MQVETALDIVGDQLVTAPDVTVTAEDHRHRYQDAIRVRVTLDGWATERDEIREHGRAVRRLSPWAEFAIPVGSLDSAEDLVGAILDVIAEARSHEDREHTRLRPTYWAPFHPHREDGIARWAARTGRDPQRDLTYGLA